MLEAQEVQFIIQKRLVPIRGESDRFVIRAVQHKDILATGEKLTTIETGSPLGEGKKSLHTPALVVEPLVVAQIESIEVLEKLKLLQGLIDSFLLFVFVSLAVVLDELCKLLACFCEAWLVIEYDSLDSRSHARFAQLDIELMAAKGAGRGDAVGGQLLFGDDGRAEDRCAVIAAPRITGSVLGPEGVDDPRPFPPVQAALVRRTLGRIDVHNLSGLPVYPAAHVATRAGCSIEGLNEGLDLGLDILEERLDLPGITAGQLVFRNEPGHGVEINARHLEAKPRAFDQRGTASHEDVEHPKPAKMPGLLVISVVMVPNPLRRL